LFLVGISDIDGRVVVDFGDPAERPQFIRRLRRCVGRRCRCMVVCTVPGGGSILYIRSACTIDYRMGSPALVPIWHYCL
jgi:hypothetical protein